MILVSQVYLKDYNVRNEKSTKEDGPWVSASFHKYGDVCGERDGIEFAKQRRRDVCVHREGGATKKLMPSRRHPSG